MVEIVKMDTTNKRDVKRFIQVQADLYRDSPYWVPTFYDEAATQLDKQKHPYYENSDAEFFVAVKDGRDVGRIALLDNRRYNEYRNEHTAFWYLFDSIDDLEVSRAIFTHAEEWARARGMNKLFGPKGFVTLDSFGVLVEGFDYLPALGGLYNYEYYDRLVTDMGHQKFTDVGSYKLAGDELDVSERVYAVADRVRERRGITIKHFRNKKELVAMIPAVIDAYNQSFTENWEFVPLTPNETQLIVKRLIDIIRPELIVLALKGDDIIGFILGFANINAAIKEINAKPWPFGFLKLLRAIKTTKWVDLNGVGVLPKYRASGVNAVMYVEMARLVQGGGFDWAELVQVEDGNAKMQLELKELGATRYKTHRLYEKKI
jgi:hypothetical protein